MGARGSAMAWAECEEVVGGQLRHLTARFRRACAHIPDPSPAISARLDNAKSRPLIAINAMRV